jgi:hypothetical protein
MQTKLKTLKNLNKYPGNPNKKRIEIFVWLFGFFVWISGFCSKNIRFYFLLDFRDFRDPNRNFLFFGFPICQIIL